MRGCKSWSEISAERLRSNYRALVDAVFAAGSEDTAVLAVIKADAYGHGIGPCAQVLAQEGVPWLGVTDAAEGVNVRRFLERVFGTERAQPRILVMCGPLSFDNELTSTSDLTPVIWTLQQLQNSSKVGKVPQPIPIHLEIDTGMSRQGVLPGASLDLFLDCLASHPELCLEGVLTHFVSAEISGAQITSQQRQRFEAALAQIIARGLSPRWIHAGNSSTIDERTSLGWLRDTAKLYGARPLVRSGLALYGYTLPLEGAKGILRKDLAPVLTWKSRILAFHQVPAGASVGYNETFTARQSMRLALLPVGYADGLRRELSATNSGPGGWVVIRGRRAPIIGRVSMNLTSVDVSSIPDVALEDEVTLLGDGITAEDHASLAGTIPYEILCGVRSQPYLAP